VRHLDVWKSSYLSSDRHRRLYLEADPWGSGWTGLLPRVSTEETEGFYDAAWARTAMTATARITQNATVAQAIASVVQAARFACHP
jgi:hypothetical protein